MIFLKRLAALLAAIVLVASVAHAAGPFPDQGTWGGTSGGSANAQTLTISNYFAKLVGVPIRGIAGFTNTSATTMNVSSTGASAVKKPSPAGLTALIGGEIVAGQPFTVTWDGSEYVLGAAAGTPITGGYQNLVVHTTSVSQVAITANALTVTDANGYGYRLVVTSAVTCNIATSGANGLDTGSEAASTWYSVWDIYNPASLTDACLLSISSTSPTLPSGYTAKMRVGWVRNDAGSNFWQTIQYGDLTQLVIGTNPTGLPAIITGSSGSVSAPTWTSTAVTSFVPTTAAAIVIVMTSYTDGSGVMAAPNNTYGAYTSTTNPPPAMIDTTGGGNSNVISRLQLESSNIFYASSGANNGIFLFGWVDNL